MSSGGGALRVTVTGASGLLGRTLVPALQARGAEVTVLSRDPDRAQSALDPGAAGAPHVVAWDPMREPAPADALAGRESVLHLAGEPVAQRWSAKAKRAIRDSRVIGTRNLVEGLRRADRLGIGQRPRTLISSSAIGYYGAHGEEPLDEETPPGSDFLAQVCVAWEQEASMASELGMRVVQVRTGVVLDARGGALQDLRSVPHRPRCEPAKRRHRKTSVPDFFGVGAVDGGDFDAMDGACGAGVCFRDVAAAD